MSERAILRLSNWPVNERADQILRNAIRRRQQQAKTLREISQELYVPLVRVHDVVLSQLGEG